MIKRKLILLIIFSLTLLLGGCKAKDPFYSPTADFYVNDSANVLLNSTKNYLYINGKILYDESNKKTIPKELRGTQIVLITTFKERGSFVHTDLFNSYGIGKNDLGVLIIAYYEKDEENDHHLKEVSYEFGKTMMNYLTGSRASELEEIYLEDPYFINDDDARLFSFYFAFIEEITALIYGFTEEETYKTFYNFDDYLDEQYDYLGPLPNENKLFPNLKTWQLILIVGALLVLGLMPKFGLIPLLIQILIPSSKGGGGKSRGYHN